MSSDEERKIHVAESLTSFSKHLMLLLAAVIAFAATPVLIYSPQFLQVCFAFGVAIGIVSFIAGHEGVAVILNAYIQRDSQDNFIALADSLTKGTLQRCKKAVEIQYWFMVASLVIIALCIMSSAFVIKKTPYNCNATSNHPAEILTSMPSSSGNRDAHAGSAAGKNDPKVDASQPKEIVKPVTPQDESHNMERELQDNRKSLPCGAPSSRDCPKSLPLSIPMGSSAKPE